MKEDAKQGFRMSARVFVNYPAQFIADHRELPGEVLQVSDGGVIFHSYERIGLGLSGGVKIKVFEKETDVYLKVTIIYELADNSHKKPSWKYGLRFSDVDGEKRDIISRIIMFSSLKNRYAARATVAMVGEIDKD